MKKRILVGLLLVSLTFSACAPLPDPGTDSHVFSDSDRPQTDTVTDSQSGSDTDAQTNEGSVPFVHDFGATTDSLGEVNESLPDSTLLYYHNMGEKFPYRLIPEVLEGYGKIMTSAETPQQAVANTTAYFTTATEEVKECVVLVETELYFGLYVRRGVKDSTEQDYEQKVVCFKPTVFDTDYLSVYRDKSGTVGALSKGVAKRVMDYWYYSRWFNISGLKVLSSKIEETENEYTYTVYYLNPLFNDWGVVLEVSLYREVTKIPKNGGAITLGKAEKLKTVPGEDADNPGYVIVP